MIVVMNPGTGPLDGSSVNNARRHDGKCAPLIKEIAREHIDLPCRGNPP